MHSDPKWIEDLGAEEDAEQAAVAAAEDAVDTAPETCCEYLLYASSFVYNPAVAAATAGLKSGFFSRAIRCNAMILG